MSTSFGIEYPLQRDGNSQQQRDLEARKPSYAPVESRNMLDLLHFWAQYAKVVLHHDKQGLQRNWSPFFDDSVPFQLAEIYQFDEEKWWASYQDFRNRTNKKAEDGLELVMGHLFAAFEQHQNWHRVLASDPGAVSQTVRNLTETNLRFILREFIGIFHVLRQRFQLVALQNPDIFLNGSSSTAWSLTPDDVYYIDPALHAKIGNRITILPHLLPRLDRIAEMLYKSQLAVRASFPATDEKIEALITRDGRHEPLVGLMLAFLDLFRTVQNDYNRLTQRHLDHFYAQVLQITKKTATPDAAHLIFELAKHVPDSYRLLSGTAFKDGKDAHKADIIFNSTEELIVNRAVVADTRTLFFGQAPKPADTQRCPPVLPTTNINVGKPYVISPAQSDYPALGRGLKAKDTLGRMGFVLSSPALKMAEGTRTVMVEFVFASPISLTANFGNLLQPAFTLNENWLEVKVFQTPPPANNHSFILLFTLMPDVKPIEALKDTVLNPYGGTDPLLKIMFDVEHVDFNAFYQQLDENNLTGIKITTTATGVKNQLVLKNDEGVLNPKKAFQPFGTAATNNFYVSHPDLEGKEITKLDFLISLNEHAKMSSLINTYRLYSPADFNRTSVRLTSSMAYDNFNEIPPVLNLNEALFADDSDTIVELIHIVAANTSLRFPDANSGIVLKLNSDYFLNQSYPLVLQRQSDAAKLFPNYRVRNAFYSLKSDQTLHLGSSLDAVSSLDFRNLYEPVFPLGPPYNPVFESFFIEYNAVDTLVSLIQLLPFKDSTEKVIIGQPVASTKTPARLVPYIKQEGALFIGIKSAPVKGNLALLFQFSEYTGNPDLKLPDIQWSVLLEKHEWMPLKKDVDYVDDTQGFVQSGVIRFELPEKVSTSHTILAPGLSWLRASVEENSEAFDHLLGVHTQAVKVVFAPAPANDLTRLDKALEAGKIKKFVQETPVIGKIDQPYAAFGGRSAENPEMYYRRVSERLRHKGRAVSLWDYEALILEEFPQIYKVKCLNHTLGLRGMKLDLEFMNGYVALVVIPDVRQLKKSQRDQPKANHNLLNDIKNFLEERISPFVRLDVLNPRYETIDTHFNVRFFPGKDDAYYENLLTTEIKDFLSPWRTDPPAEIQFGGEVYRSSIIRFIEERTYVDYVTNFVMNNDGALKSMQAQTARSVLSAGQPTMTVIKPPNQP